MAYISKNVCICDGCGMEVEAKTITYGRYGNRNAPNKWIRLKWGDSTGYNNHKHFHSYGCLGTWAAKEAKTKDKKKSTKGGKK